LTGTLTWRWLPAAVFDPAGLGAYAGLERALWHRPQVHSPRIDVALAALVAHHRLLADAAFGLFASARSVGLLAHSIEQLAEPQLIRPREALGRPDAGRIAGRVGASVVFPATHSLHRKYRVVFTDVIVETLGQQGDLASVLSLNESLHVAARSVALPSILPAALRDQSVFTRPRPEAVICEADWAAR